MNETKKHTAEEWASYHRAAVATLARFYKLHDAFAHEIETLDAAKLDSPHTAQFIVAELSHVFQEAESALIRLESWLKWLGADDVDWLKDTLEGFDLPAADAQTIATWAAEQNKRGMLAEKRRKP